MNHQSKQTAKLITSGVITRAETGEVIDLGVMSTGTVDIKELMYGKHPNLMIRGLWWLEKKLRGLVK